MKKFLTLLSGLCAGLALQAQITVTNATFFGSGDTLKVARAGNPEAVQAGSAGTNLTWDFSMLSKDTGLVFVVKAASQGSAFGEFPDAEVFVNNGFGETYYSISSTAITNLGFLTSGFNGVPVTLTPKYNPSLVERRAPMNYFDVNTADASFLITFSTDIVPDTFFANLPFKPDSIRLNQMIGRLDVVDAWGSLSIPGGTYPVLRERRRAITSNTVELKIFGIWVDLGSLGIQFPGVGVDTSLTYVYFSGTEKEPIAEVSVNPDNEAETLGVTYKDNGVSSLHQPTRFADPLFLGPQPSTGMVRFDLTPLADPAVITVFDASGRLVRQWAGCTGILVLDLSDLASGTWIYRVNDNRGLLESGTLQVRR